LTNPTLLCKDKSSKKQRKKDLEHLCVLPRKEIPEKLQKELLKRFDNWKR